MLEDPWNEYKEDMFQMTVSPEKAPAKPEIVTIGFVKGNPVSINGKKYAPDALVEKLNTIAGRNGVGRVDVVESRYVGMKSRGVYESPGITVLHAAHRAVETITLDREEIFLKDSMMPMYARMAYFGYWFAPEREALQAMVDKIEEKCTGDARLKLYKGNVIVSGRRSPRSLYDTKIASFEEAGGYRQGDATGFINLNALRLRIKSLVDKKNEK